MSNFITRLKSCISTDFNHPRRSGGQVVVNIRDVEDILQDHQKLDQLLRAQHNNELPNSKDAILHHGICGCGGIFKNKPYEERAFCDCGQSAYFKHKTPYMELQEKFEKAVAEVNFLQRQNYEMREALTPEVNFKIK